MAMRMLASIKTHKKKFFVIHAESFVAQRATNYVAFDNPFSKGGNWLSSNSSQATSTMERSNHAEWKIFLSS